MVGYDKSIPINKLKCVKCESSTDLVPYKFSEWTGLKHKKHTYYKIIQHKWVPICRNCQSTFNQWDKVREKVGKPKSIRGIAIVVIILLSIYIIMNIYGGIPYGGRHLFVAAIGAVVILFIVAVIFTIKIFKIKQDFKQFKPTNYIHFKKKGQLYIKPENSTSWINYNDWIKKILGEGN